MIEQIDAELITRYLAACSTFRSKATVYATLSTMRRFGDYLVGQGLWPINPLRWMKGPKVTPYSRLPKRIDHAHMEAMWREAASRPQVTVSVVEFPQPHPVTLPAPRPLALPTDIDATSNLPE